MDYQSIFERHEIKYILTPNQYYKILSEIKKRCREDKYPTSTITSLYYDTPDRLLARRSLDHPAYKEKLRLRVYGRADESSTAFAEIKKKYNSVTYKRRIGLNVTEAQMWLNGDKHRYLTQIEKEIDRFMLFYKNICPAAIIAYERDSFFSDSDGLRLTFDKNVRFRADDLDLLSGSYGELLLPEGTALLEAKSAVALPVWFSRLMSENGIYSAGFSKFGAAYIKTLNYSDNGGKKYA